MDKSNFILFLRKKKSETTGILSEFESELKENPKYAFEWCKNAVKASVWLSEINVLLKNTDKLNIECVKDYYNEAILNTSRYITNISTSQPKNLIRCYELEVKSELFAVLNNPRKEVE